MLDPLSGYLVFAEELTNAGARAPAALNFGPLSDEELTVAEVATAVLDALRSPVGFNVSNETHVVEMEKLALDASAASDSLGWKPGLVPRAALAWTAEWYRLVNEGRDAKETTLQQIDRYRQLGRPT